MEPTSAQSSAPVAPAEAAASAAVDGGAAAPAAAPEALLTASPDATKAEIAVLEPTAQPECLVTVEDGTNPVVLALAALSILGLCVNLIRGKKRA